MFVDVLRFWLDRGVDGFRVDVAHGLFKEESLRDQVVEDGRDRQQRRPRPADVADGRAHPARRADVGPARGARRLPALARGARQVRRRPDARRRGVDPDARSRWRATSAPTRCSQAFNFAWLLAPLVGRGVHRGHHRHHGGRRARSAAPPPGCSATTTSSGTSSRYGGGAVGLARAQAATLTMLALPGSAYLYQGEELGLRAGRRRAASTGRTRSGSAPASAAATAAGCRSRGAATPRRTASVRAPASRGSRSRPTGRALTVEAEDGDPDVDARLLPRGARRPAYVRDDRGRRGRDARPRRRRAGVPARPGDRGPQLRHRRRSPLPDGRGADRQRPGRRTRCRADTAVWLR